MARMKDLAVATSDQWKWDPRKLEIDPDFNVRVEGPDLEAHILDLMEQIRPCGVKEPLTVYMKGDTPVITNGHCRYRAVMRLIAEGVDIVSVPIRVEERGSNEVDFALSMITRNSGLPLTPYETALVYKKLQGYGLTTAMIAEKVGKTQPYVEQLLDLLSAPVAVLDKVKKGEVSATLAAKVVRKEGANAPAVLEEAQAIAKQSGKAKVTPKHVKQAACGTASGPVKKPGAAKEDCESLSLFEASNLTEDAIIESLGEEIDEETREKVMDAIKPVLARILKARSQAKDADLAKMD